MQTTNDLRLSETPAPDEAPAGPRPAQAAPRSLAARKISELIERAVSMCKPRYAAQGRFSVSANSPTCWILNIRPTCRSKNLSNVFWLLFDLMQFDAWREFILEGHRRISDFLTDA